MLKQVILARKVIKSGLLTENEITSFCNWLGFSDTAFRDKSSKDKLKDFLLSPKY